MGILKVAGGSVGGAVGVAAGATGGAAVGALDGALSTVSLATRKKEKVEVDGKEVDAYVKKIPGLAETLATGVTLAVLTAVFALQPQTWPVVGWLAAKVGASGAMAGFLAGLSLQAIGNVTLKSIGGAIGGLGLGAVGGAKIGANLFERLSPKKRAEIAEQRAALAEYLETHKAALSSSKTTDAEWDRVRALRRKALGS